jgi:DNA-binding MarR family transcriptional regulator
MSPKTTSMDVRNFILSHVAKYPDSIARITSEKFEISRQAVNRHLKKLVGEGLIESSGSTRAKTYHLLPTNNKEIVLKLGGLTKDRVWSEHFEALFSDIPSSINSILFSVFTEILNNAIDHSEGTQVSIKFKKEPSFISFWIVDNGIGIFRKIKSFYHLDDEKHAVFELTKGKLTTDKARHTGQGIFFSSRMVDRFIISSHNLSLICNASNLEKSSDWLFEDSQDQIQGTEVTFRVNVSSTKTSASVFSFFEGKDKANFAKTIVPVQIAQFGKEEMISRSQAKRILARLEKFEEFVLDFHEIGEIGQGFADEIFRVFQNKHPNIHITTIRTSESIDRMIRRALNS